MEPNKPLTAEEKLELEMDKVVEIEQQPLFEKKSKFWKGFLIGIVVGIIVLAIYLLYPKRYSDYFGDRYTCFGYSIPDEGPGPGGHVPITCFGYLRHDIDNSSI